MDQVNATGFQSITLGLKSNFTTIRPNDALSQLLCISSSRLLGSVLAVVAALIVYRWAGKRFTQHKGLPGPWNIPFVGRVHDVDPKAPWFKQAEWCFKYNGLYQTTIMGETHVWIGSQRVAQDLLAKRAPIYSSRPQVPAMPGSDTLPHYLPLMAHGEAWKRHRKFTTTMQNLARDNSYFGYIDIEAKRFLAELMKDTKGYYRLIDEFTGRISARLNYGSPDTAAQHVRNAYEFIPQISPGGPVTNLMPFLIHLPEAWNTSKRFVRERRAREGELWHGLIDEARESFRQGTPQPKNFVRTYFERKQASVTGEAFGFNPDDDEFAYAVGMLCTVAIFTIGGPLNTFFLAMVLHPEWQQRAREEIDTVLGDRTVATRADAPKLPVLRAVIKEALRWRPAVPLGVPRLVEEDNIYEGHLIKKGTVAHVVELAISRDPELYPDPETFNPARWLEKQYPSYREPLTEHPALMGHHQFGSGLRICPGITLTEAELLAACSGLLSAFRLDKRVVDGKVIEPDPWKMTSNLIGGPLEFDFNLVPREGAKERVESLWRDAEARETLDGYSGKLQKMALDASHS